MRRALGLNASGGNATFQQRPDQARQRHRFVQDGGVPVTVLNHRTDETAALRERISALEASLDAERAAHAATRRTSAEQQTQLQSLETRLGHTELAHRDAIALEQRAQTTLKDHIAQLQAARPARAPRAEPALEPRAPRTESTAETAPPATPEGGDLFGTADADSADVPRKRGRPRLHAFKDPKPVRWWTPSFKAKTKA